jgi:hypothetical protein
MSLMYPGTVVKEAVVGCAPCFETCRSRRAEVSEENKAQRMQLRFEETDAGVLMLKIRFGMILL